MRHTLVLLFSLILALIAALASSQKASASESARDLASDCRNLEQGRRGAGAHIKIPNTKEALQCWGYMRAMQDLSVLADQDGHRIMGSCPPEQTTVLQLIHVFVTHARSHPGELEGNAALVVIKALGDAFPCHQP
ncbi:MAG: Rap1a/Tai family immunity protein [Xanthobacteraceae bacterium]